MHINKQLMFNFLKFYILKNNYIKNVENELLYLIEIILFSDPTKNYIFKGNPALKKIIPKYKSLFYSSKTVGIPIGNLTSQFFANIYLNEFDQFVKRELKIKYYCRYVDDFILFNENKEYLKICKIKIEKFLKNNLKVKLHPKKQTLQKVSKGISFVGFFIKPYYSLPLNKNFSKIKKLFFELNEYLIKINNLYEMTIDYDYLEKLESQINSYLGFISHCESYNLRKYLFGKYSRELRHYFLIDKDYNKINLKKYKKMTIKKILKKVNKENNNLKLILFEIGNFYKAYDEHSITLNKITNCKLVYRKPFLYTGFPKMSEKKYFEILKNNNVSFITMKKDKETEEYKILKSFSCEKPIKIAEISEFEEKYLLMKKEKNKTKIEIDKEKNSNDDINEIIKKIDLVNLTPLEAFNLIVKIKEIQNKNTYKHL